MRGFGPRLRLANWHSISPSSSRCVASILTTSSFGPSLYVAVLVVVAVAVGGAIVAHQTLYSVDAVLFLLVTGDSLSEQAIGMLIWNASRLKIDKRGRQPPRCVQVGQSPTRLPPEGGDRRNSAMRQWAVAGAGRILQLQLQLRAPFACWRASLN